MTRVVNSGANVTSGRSRKASLAPCLASTSRSPGTEHILFLDPIACRDVDTTIPYRATYLLDLESTDHSLCVSLCPTPAGVRNQMMRRLQVSVPILVARSIPPSMIFTGNFLCSPDLFGGIPSICNRREGDRKRGKSGVIMVCFAKSRSVA